MKNFITLFAVVCSALFITASANTHTVSVGFGGNNFSPNAMTICLGDTVYFVWSSGVHTVDFTSPDEAVSPVLTALGDTFKYVPLVGGAYTYECSIHGGMMSGGFMVNDLQGGSSASVGNVTCNGANNGFVNITPGGGTPAYTFSWNTGATTGNYTGLAPGSYSVTLTDAAGCTASGTIPISEPAILLVNVDAVGNVLCNGASTGSISITVTGGTMPYTYNWSGGETTDDLAGIPAGSYTLTVNDFNNCIQTVTVAVSEPPVLSTSATFNNITCNGDANGNINLSVIGGTLPYTFAWSNTETTEDIGLLAPNTYSVLVTDACGATSTESIVISEPAVLTISAGTGLDVSCFGGSDGSIDITVTGGTLPYTFAWNNGATTEDLSAIPAGSYSILITDANGCTFADGGPISEPAQIVITVDNVVPSTSCNSADGAINTTVVGGTPALTYSWMPGGASTDDVAGLNPGTYTLTVTDANNCQSVKSVVVPNANPITATIDNVLNASCNLGSNGQILVTSGGGMPSLTYMWTPGMQTTEDVTGLTAGDYTITVSDAVSCAMTLTATVTEPNALVVSTNSTTNVSCTGGNNGAIDISVTGGTGAYTYMWMPNMESTEDIAGLIAGTYNVNVWDANACNATATFTITQPSTALNVLINGTTNPCAAGATASGSIDIVVSGGTGAYTYNWSNAETTEDVTGLTAGTYSVLVTDANGCMYPVTNIVLGAVVINVTVDLVTDVTCNGGNDGAIAVSSSGGQGGYVFDWQPGSMATEDISGLTADTYTLTVLEMNGCTGTATATVNEPAALAVVVDNITDASDCTTPDGAIDITVTGGTTAYTYNWMPGNLSTDDISGLVMGDYVLTLTDANNCMSTTTVTVGNSNPTSVNLGPDVTQCGGSAVLDAGAGYTSYLWSEGSTTQTITAMVSGTFYVDVTDACGNASDTVVVSIDAMPSVNIGPDATMCGGGILLNAGNTGSAYLWSDNSTAQTLNASSTNTYWVIVTNSCGGDTDSVSVTINPGVVINLGSDITTCAVNVLLDAMNAGPNYAWSEGSSTQQINVTTSGTYSVVVTDANGCSGSDAINVTFNTVPLVNLGPDSTWCGSGMLDAGNPGSTYLWSDASTNQTIAVSTSGTYYVDVTNGCGTSSDTVVITINTAPTISAGANVTSCSGGNTTLCASGGATYLWSPSGQSTSCIVVSPTANTTYMVTGTDASGCTNTATVSITTSGPSASTTSTPSSCAVNDGSATANPSGGTPGYTYLWTGGQATQTATGLGAGVYTVTVTDAMGCSTTALASVTTTSSNLQTTFAGGNGQNGNIFDITAITNVQIISFDGNLDDAASAGAGGNVEIWYRPGSYVGFENASTGWTNAGNVFVNPTAVGVPTAIPINLNLTIPAGQTYAFYVTGNITGCDVDYTNGTLVGNPFAQDANIQIKEGLGKAYPFGASFTPRVWNGVVNYCANVPIGTETNSLSTARGVNVYPNPFVANATVVLTGADMTNGADLIITDVFGREVMAHKVHTAEYKIEKGDLPAGVYFYKVTDASGTVGTGKLVIE